MIYDFSISHPTRNVIFHRVGPSKRKLPGKWRHPSPRRPTPARSSWSICSACTPWNIYLDARWHDEWHSNGEIMRSAGWCTRVSARQMRASRRVAPLDRIKNRKKSMKDIRSTFDGRLTRWLISRRSQKPWAIEENVINIRFTDVSCILGCSRVCVDFKS